MKFLTRLFRRRKLVGEPKPPTETVSADPRLVSAKPPTYPEPYPRYNVTEKYQDH